MPWYRIRTDLDARGLGGAFHLHLDKRHATPACTVCGYIATRQCDRIVDRTVLKHGEPKRCDRWICEYCTTEPEPGKDLCPPCAQLFKGWLAGRTNSVDGAGP